MLITKHTDLLFYLCYTFLLCILCAIHGSLLWCNLFNVNSGPGFMLAVKGLFMWQVSPVKCKHVFMTGRCYIFLTFFICDVFSRVRCLYISPGLQSVRSFTGGWSDQRVNAVSRRLISQHHAPAAQMALWGFVCAVYYHGPAVSETLLFPAEFICSHKSQISRFLSSTRFRLLNNSACKHTCADIWRSGTVSVMFGEANKIREVANMTCMWRSLCLGLYVLHVEIF